LVRKNTAVGGGTDGAFTPWWYKNQKQKLDNRRSGKKCAHQQKSRSWLGGREDLTGRGVTQQGVTTNSGKKRVRKTPDPSQRVFARRSTHKTAGGAPLVLKKGSCPVPALKPSTGDNEKDEKVAHQKIPAKKAKNPRTSSVENP